MGLNPPRAWRTARPLATVTWAEPEGSKTFQRLVLMAGSSKLSRNGAADPVRAKGKAWPQVASFS